MVPVTLHHLRTAQADLAHFAEGDGTAIVVQDGRLRARQGNADLTAPRVDGHRVGNRHRRAFGQAIPLHQRHAGTLFPALCHHVLHRHAARHSQLQRSQFHRDKTRRIEQRAKERVDADDRREAGVLQHLEEGRQIARVGDQHRLRPLSEEGQCTRQGKHVVQRQGQDQRFLAVVQVGRHPGAHLKHIGHHVAVAEHRPFGHTGGATGVLQKGQVAVPQVDVVQGPLTASRQCAPEIHRPGQVPRGHQLLDMFDHGIGQQPLQRWQQIPHLRRHHRAHGG